MVRLISAAYLKSFLVWDEITILGDFRFWVVFAALTLLLYRVLPRKFLRKLYFVVMPATVLAAAFSEGLKELVQSPRPCTGFDLCPEGFSFPSSHAVIAFAAFTAIYLGFEKRKRKYLLIFIIPVLVAISRIAVGVHRAEDVVAGSAIGAAVAFGYLKAYQRIRPGKK